MNNKQVLQDGESNIIQSQCRKNLPGAIARLLTPLLLVLVMPHQIFAAGPAPVNLRSTANFEILAGAAVTSTGGGTINGNVGASPIAGSAIGVTCAQVNGQIYAVDASGPACAVVSPTLLTTAKGDLTTAYNDAAGRTPIPSGSNLNPGAAYSSGYNIGGMTLAPGLYKFGSGQTAFIETDVTLSGSPNDVWIFQCGADLQVANGVHIILSGGAQAANIFWQVTSSAVIGTTAVFNGTILANQAITMNTGSTMNGRSLAFTAGVTFNSSAATVPTASDSAIIVSTNVFVDYLSAGITPITLNPQTGLFTNSVLLTNSGSISVSGVRLYVLNLPADVQVYYASGSTTNGTPYFEYDYPLAPAASVDFTIEYYRPSRQPFPTPTYVPQDITNAVPLTVTNGVGVPNITLTRINGRFLVGFYAIPGRTYAVQYSTNIINWLTADPLIVAPANYVQWYDQGPPETQPLPGTRYYKVLQLP